MDYNAVPVDKTGITAERHANPSNTMAYRLIMTVTVIREEKTKVSWREMLSDARLEVRRIWRQARCDVEV